MTHCVLTTTIFLSLVVVCLFLFYLPLLFSFVAPSCVMYYSISTVHYNNVEGSGIENEVAYLSADLSLFSIDFDLVNMQKVPLCYDMYADNNQEDGAAAADEVDYYDNADAAAEADYYDNADAAADNNGGGRRRRLHGRRVQYENCPGDGSYAYSIDYVLPSAGRESASWLASGWSGTGVLELYAQRNENMKIGQCTMKLSTYVTPGEESDSLIGTPSAAATAGIVLAVLAAIFLMCFYCYCCRRSNTKNRAGDGAKSVNGGSNGDDVISTFRRMDEGDDNKSKPSTIDVSSGASQAESKRSFMPWVTLGGNSDDASKQQPIV
jgi:hypothetical protein